MYRVVLAERDYERHINEILRKKIEELQHEVADLRMQIELLNTTDL